MGEIWQTQLAGERAKAWRTQALSNLEFLHATYITHSFPQHTHDEFCIGVIIDGAEKVKYRGTTYFAPVGSVVTINPGEAHANWAADEGGWTYQVFYPTVRLLQQAASEVGQFRQTPCFRDPVIQDPVLFQRLCRLHRLLEQPASLLERESHLLLALVQLVGRHARDFGSMPAIGRENRAVQQVKDYLEAHSWQNPSLSQLAQIAHLSPFHLNRVFRRTVGLPPHAYLTQVRVNRAKRLLCQGLSIARVAAETGFCDRSHFTKRFKRLVGVTPRHYGLGSQNLL
jgi:AraC-like DNA-binding protein